MENEIAKMREMTKLSQEEFAEKYRIPLQELQDWESGKAAPPEYVVYLLREKVNSEYDKKTLMYDALRCYLNDISGVGFYDLLDAYLNASEKDPESIETDIAWRNLNQRCDIWWRQGAVDKMAYDRWFERMLAIEKIVK